MAGLFGFGPTHLIPTGKEFTNPKYQLARPLMGDPLWSGMAKRFAGEKPPADMSGYGEMAGGPNIYLEMLKKQQGIV